MRNDRERRGFVADEKNWKLVQDIMGLVQLRMFRYKGKAWYAVFLRQIYQQWDRSVHEMTKTAGWIRVGIYQLDTARRAFTYGIDPAEIVEAMREADKEERKNNE